MSELDDLLAGAKGSLVNAQQLSDTTGLTAIEAEQAKNQAAFEQHKADQGLSNPVSRFLKGGWSQSIVNPANWKGAASAIAHPIMNIVEPSAEAFKRSVEAPDTATKATELMRAIPVVGNPTVNATDKMLGGDIAGGAGELAGIISNFPASEAAVKAAPDITSAVGRGTSATGRTLQNVAGKAFNAKIDPMTAAAMEVLTGHPYAAAATVATPYALKYGGILTEKAGNALEGLGARMKNPGTPAEAPVGPEYPESWKPFINREKVSSEIPTEPDGGWGSPETTTQPTTASNSILGSPALQGLKQNVSEYATTRDMSSPAITESYNRGGMPYSDEALQWLKAHTAQDPEGSDLPFQGPQGAPEGPFGISAGRTTFAADPSRVWKYLDNPASLAALVKNP